MGKAVRVLSALAVPLLFGTLAAAQDLMNDDSVSATISSVSGGEDGVDYRSPSSWIDISWELSAPGGRKLTIDLLYENSTFCRKIGTALPKMLKYNWTLPNNINTDEYRIRVGYSDNSTAVSDSFKIKYDAFADPTVEATIAAITQPQNSQRVPGDQIIVMWTVGTPGGKKVNIDLVKSDDNNIWLVSLVRELTTVAPNATGWTWTVPADLVTGKYAIRIGYPSINKVNYSPTFPIKTSVVAVTSSSTSSSSASQAQQQEATNPATATASHPTEGGVSFTWTVIAATAIMVAVARGYVMP